MHARARHVVLAVTAGFLLTVANAWMCALFPHLPTTMKVVPGSSDWPDTAPDSWDGAVNATRGSNRVTTLASWGCQGADRTSHRSVDHVESGWPVRLMRAARVIEFEDAKLDTTKSPAVRTAFREVLLDYPGSLHHTRSLLGLTTYLGALPLQPIYGPFLLHWLTVSTLLTSPLIWRTAIAPIRRRRNLCPACAYSLSGLAPATTICPECGAPVTPASVAMRQPPPSAT